jgi:hypothetical protein
MDYMRNDRTRIADRQILINPAVRYEICRDAVNTMFAIVVSCKRSLGAHNRARNANGENDDQQRQQKSG